MEETRALLSLPETIGASTMATTTPADLRYLEPKGGTLLFNRIVARLTRMGLSVWGSRELQVVGRRSGELRTTPVNLLELGDATYLVAPRGTTQWVRNLRAAQGRGGLRLGRHVDEFTSAEVADADKVEVLRAYLRRWKFEVGAFFDGVDASSSDEELLAIAPGHPVFRIEIVDRRRA
jgi:deazaflavin-dependent oxidoreductase (nitroreductase family)